MQCSTTRQENLIKSGKNSYHNYNYKMPGNVIKLFIFKSMLVPVTYTTTSEYFTFLKPFQIIVRANVL